MSPVEQQPATPQPGPAGAPPRPAASSFPLPLQPPGTLPNPAQAEISAWCLIAAVPAAILLESLRTWPVGLNAMLAVLLLVLAVWFVGRQTDVARPQLAVVAFLVAFSPLFVLRDSSTLLIINLLTVGCALATLVVAAHRDDLVHVTLEGLGVRWTMAVAGAAAFAPMALGEIPWRRARSLLSPKVLEPVVGIAIGIPLLVLFGSLFAAADPQFRSIVDAAFPSFDRLFVHAFVAIVLAYLLLGALRDQFALPRVPNPDLPMPTEAGTGASLATDERAPFGEHAMVLVIAMLDALFALFVALQLPYLFGGHDLIAEVDGLTYADYAHQGFGQLVAVAFLTLVLLVASSALRERHGWHGRAFHIAGVLLVLLALVVVASAMQRMGAYVDAFGLTELRLYVVAFLAWVATVLAACAATVVLGRPRFFASAAVVLAALTVVTLNLINPEAIIARTNIERLSDLPEGAGVTYGNAGVDQAYLRNLNADAVPALIEQMHDAPEELRPGIAVTLSVMRGREWYREDQGWRSSNLSRHRAEEALREHEDEINELVVQHLTESRRHVPQD